MTALVLCDGGDWVIEAGNTISCSGTIIQNTDYNMWLEAIL